MHSEPTIDPRLLSVEACAEALGISRSRVLRLLRSAELDWVKIGARRLIPVDAIDEYVARLREEQRGQRP